MPIKQATSEQLKSEEKYSRNQSSDLFLFPTLRTYLTDFPHPQNTVDQNWEQDAVVGALNQKKKKRSLKRKTALPRKVTPALPNSCTLQYIFHVLFGDYWHHAKPKPVCLRSAFFQDRLNCPTALFDCTSSPQASTKHSRRTISVTVLWIDSKEQCCWTCQHAHLFPIFELPLSFSSMRPEHVNSTTREWPETT